MIHNIVKVTYKLSGYHLPHVLRHMACSPRCLPLGSCPRDTAATKLQSIMVATHSDFVDTHTRTRYVMQNKVEKSTLDGHAAVRTLHAPRVKTFPGEHVEEHDNAPAALNCPSKHGVGVADPTQRKRPQVHSSQVANCQSKQCNEGD